MAQGRPWVRGGGIDAKKEVRRSVSDGLAALVRQFATAVNVATQAEAVSRTPGTRK